MSLRAAAVLAPLLALLGTGLELRWPPVWLVVVVALLSLATAAWPEALTGTLALALVVVWWAVAARDDLPVTVVPAAVLLLVGHLAPMVLAHGPRRLAVDGWLARTWLRRGALTALAAPAVWAASAVLRDQPAPPGVWVAALVAAVAACVVAGAGLAAVEESS